MARILLIDDDEINREVMSAVLEDADFQVALADTGAHGLAAAEAERPDLVLCDMVMPGMDGYAVLTALRARPATHDVPFVFLTAVDDLAHLRQAMEQGADDYLIKPCDAEELVKAIRSRLARYAATRRAAEVRLEELRANVASSLPHELRTPLSGILGYADLLAEDFDAFSPADARKMVEAIRNSARRLERLIENFLLYAELEMAGRDPRLGEAIRSARASRLPEAVAGEMERRALEARRGSDLQMEIAPASVEISARWLAKLMGEVLDNALKFSRPGRPVRVAGAPDAGGGYVLAVADQGRGMTPEQIQRVGAYVQFERKVHEQQGSGLGLALARRLAELHGGSLSIESAAGEGTVVHVRIPRGPA